MTLSLSLSFIIHHTLNISSHFVQYSLCFNPFDAFFQYLWFLLMATLTNANFYSSVPKYHSNVQHQIHIRTYTSHSISYARSIKLNDTFGNCLTLIVFHNYAIYLNKANVLFSIAVVRNAFAACFSHKKDTYFMYLIALLF